MKIFTISAYENLIFQLCNKLECDSWHSEKSNVLHVIYIIFINYYLTLKQPQKFVSCIQMLSILYSSSYSCYSRPRS